VNISEMQTLFIPHINCGGVLFGPEKSSPLCKQKKKTSRRDGTRSSNEGNIDGSKKWSLDIWPDASQSYASYKEWHKDVSNEGGAFQIRI
jgi:hypothetical protein